MKIAYVTGATGCVGRNLVNVLERAGWRIFILHRKSSDISRLNGSCVNFLEVDLHDIASVRRSIPSHVDAIFHVAGNTSHWATEKDEQWRDNVLATRNLARIAREKNVNKFVLTSTGATLPYKDFDEKQSMGIEQQYIRTKRLAEIELQAEGKKGLQFVVLHPIIVVGAYDYNSYSQIFKELKYGKLKIAFPGRIAFCHAEDVAAAHVQAFEHGRNGEGYVLGGTYTTWLDAFQRICKIVGVAPPRRATPMWMLKTVAHGMNVFSKFAKSKPQLTPELLSLLRDAPDVDPQDKKKAANDLGYESRSLDIMLEDCHEWLKKENKI